MDRSNVWSARKMTNFNRIDAIDAEKTLNQNLSGHRVSGIKMPSQEFAQPAEISRDISTERILVRIDTDFLRRTVLGIRVYPCASVVACSARITGLT